MIPTVGFNMRKITKGNVTIKVGTRAAEGVGGWEDRVFGGGVDSMCLCVECVCLCVGMSVGACVFWEGVRACVWRVCVCVWGRDVCCVYVCWGC